MKQIKGGQNWRKRHSLNQNTQKTDNFIFRFLSIDSDCLPYKDQLHKNSVQIKQTSESSLMKKMPPILRFISKKYLRQQQQKLQYKDPIYKEEKTLAIKTFSLKQLEPINSKSPSLPKLKKKYVHKIIDSNTAQFQSNFPEEFTTVKLKLQNKNEIKIRKQILQMLDNRSKIKNTIFNNNQMICGWKTTQINEQNILIT